LELEDTVFNHHVVVAQAAKQWGGSVAIKNLPWSVIHHAPQFVLRKGPATVVAI